MKQKNPMWVSTSFLVAAVLAIIAFVRSNWQIPLLVGAFAIWGLRVFMILGLPALRVRRNRWEQKRKDLEAENLPDSYSGRFSRSPSIVLSGIGMGPCAVFAVWLGGCPIRPWIGTKPQSLSSSRSPLSRVTPSFLMYSSSSREPDTQSRLPFLTLAFWSLRITSPRAQTW